MDVDEAGQARVVPVEEWPEEDRARALAGAYTCPACGLNFPRSPPPHREERCRELNEQAMAEIEPLIAASIAGSVFRAREEQYDAGGGVRR